MPSTPIILFTVCVDSFVKEEARSAGIDDVVSKAEHLSVLTARVRDLLSSEAA
jgi:PleD family two-component response regulator